MFPIARSVPVAADLISGKRQRKHAGVAPSMGGGQEPADSGELEGKVFPTRPALVTDIFQLCAALTDKTLLNIYC